MTRYLHDDAIDASLEYIADNGDKLTVCATAPNTFTEATVDNMLMETTLTTGDGNGDYTIGDYSAGGRKLTVSAQNDVTVDSSGTADHFAIVDTTNSKLLLVTPCQSMELTAGNTENLNSFDWVSKDPVEPS
ncbi:MAG: hypothetical protein ACOCQD_00590 [archaeon]